MENSTADNPASPPAPCSSLLPPYEEWRKLPPDDAARILARAKNLDAEEEGFIAAILEWFPSKERQCETNA